MTYLIQKIQKQNMDKMQEDCAKQMINLTIKDDETLPVCTECRKVKLKTYNF